MGFEDVEPTPEEGTEEVLIPDMSAEMPLLMLMTLLMKNQCMNGIGIIQK